MELTKRIKRENGTIELTVILWVSTSNYQTDRNGKLFRWDFVEKFIPAGKRKPILNTNFATEQDKKDLMNELHELIKPEN